MVVGIEAEFRARVEDGRREALQHHLTECGLDWQRVDALAKQDVESRGGRMAARSLVCFALRSVSVLHGDLELERLSERTEMVMLVDSPSMWSSARDLFSSPSPGSVSETGFELRFIGAKESIVGRVRVPSISFVEAEEALVHIGLAAGQELTLCLFNAPSASAFVDSLDRARQAHPLPQIVIVHRSAALQNIGESKRKRFLVLLFGSLLVYCSASSKTPRYVIPLTDAKIDCLKMKRNSRKSCFSVSRDGRTFTFFLHSETQGQYWRQALAIASNHESPTYQIEGEGVQNFARHRRNDAPSDTEADNRFTFSEMSNSHFFKFVHEKLYSSDAAMYSCMPCSDHWLRMSRVPIMKRSESLRRIDRALLVYNRVCQRAMLAVRQAILLFEDKPAVSMKSYISFSFPEMASELLNVGNLSCIEPMCFFRVSGKQHVFSSRTWNGALKAISTAKELMQHPPYTASICEANQWNQARHVACESARQLLHCLVIADFCNRSQKDLAAGGMRMFTMNVVLQSRSYSNVDCLRKLAKNRTYAFNPDSQDIENSISNPHQSMSDSWFVFTPTKWLQALRQLNVVRWYSMQELSEAVETWKSSWQGHYNKHDKRYLAVVELETSIHREMEELSTLLSMLPQFNRCQSLLQGDHIM